MTKINGKTLVTGATGFIGRSLIPALTAAGHQVVAASRHDRRAGVDQTVQSGGGTHDPEWRTCDVLSPATLPAMFADITVAYYLVHSMGSGHTNFREIEQQSAKNFADAAADAGVKRIVYLGGPAPAGQPSEHLASRLAVGEVLRSGSVPTVELRASMVIGNGSASWQIVRDLAKRLPIMILPRWLRSRTCPVALDDVITALTAAASLPLTSSQWFDIPGPEVLSGREILERIASQAGRRIRAFEFPGLTPNLSALWLRLVTEANFSLARELVLGLAQDLLPASDRFWSLIGLVDPSGKPSLVGFDEAARRALAHEVMPESKGSKWHRIILAEERLVGRMASRTRKRGHE